MEFREARVFDRPAIRDVARRSLVRSYSIETETIVDAVDEWYDDDRLAERIDDDEELLLTAVVSGQVVAFSDSTLTGEHTGELYWIHVDPAYRSRDIGEQLFERTRDRLADRGAEHLHGRVLADNIGGNEFYERHGLVKVGDESVEIADSTYTENIYAKPTEDGLEAVEHGDDTVYIDHSTQETGSIAPFRMVYTGPSGDELYGYWCSKCESLANAMDSMGRIQCDECGNARKATRWDAAYL